MEYSLFLDRVKCVMRMKRMIERQKRTRKIVGVSGIEGIFA